MPLTKIGKWSVLGTVLVLEVAAAGASYVVWTRCNNSQGNYPYSPSKLIQMGKFFYSEYRKWMYHHHPRLLDSK